MQIKNRVLAGILKLDSILKLKGTKMDRLEFLKQACKIARQQVSDSSCLTGKEFKDIMKSDDTEEVALYRRAAVILKDAAYDAENALKEVIEFYGRF